MLTIKATPLNKNFGLVLFVKSERMTRSNMIVPSYQPDDSGLVKCVPVQERNLHRPTDGNAFEISNLMFGAMPEQLAQIQTLDQQTAAEKITSACVRRFGTLKEQRDKLNDMFNHKDDE